MDITTSIRNLIANTNIVLHPDTLTIVSIDLKETKKVKALLSSLDPFFSVTFDISEVSLILNSSEWVKLKDNFCKFKEEGPYNLITFDIILDLSIVGYLAIISRTLADAGISIFALSTYLRDHILVNEKDVTEAVKILKKLRDDSRKTINIF